MTWSPAVWGPQAITIVWNPFHLYRRKIVQSTKTSLPATTKKWVPSYRFSGKCIYKKIILVILPFKQNIDVEPEEEEDYLSDDYFEEDSEGYFLFER